MSLFKGVATALVTPFAGNNLDTLRLTQQVNFQLQSGINALVALGTTGESVTLTEGERDTVITLCAKAIAEFNQAHDTKIPLIVGTGSNDTKKAVDYSKRAFDLGADGLLVVTPYYNKCNQHGLLQYFQTVADATPLPNILYSVPSRTHLSLLPQTLLALAKHPNIIAIKDASSHLTQMQDYIHLLGKLPKPFGIYCGDDAMFIPYLSQQSDGVISVLSNAFPAPLLQIYNHCTQGDYAKANALWQALLPLSKAIFADINPIGIKTAMQLLHRDSGTLRSPLCKPTQKIKHSLKKELLAYTDLPQA